MVVVGMVVVVGMMAAAKVEAEMAAVEKGAVGMEEEMAEATGAEQKVAPMGKAAARPRLSWQLGEISRRLLGEISRRLLGEISRRFYSRTRRHSLGGSRRQLVRHLRSSMR